MAPRTDEQAASSFTYTKEQLSTFYDPKSLLKFLQLFDSANPTAQLLTSLNTSASVGLPSTLPDLQQRVSHYGVNRLPQRKPKSFLTLAWEALQDKVLILLSVAAVISLALGLYETFGQPPEHDAQGNVLPKVDWVEGVAIIVAILVVVLVSAANDFQKERQFARLNTKKDSRDVVVLRSGDELMVSVYDLLVGDIIMIQTGEILPVDAVLVDGTCECDESSITGESKTIIKTKIEDAAKKFTSSVEFDPQTDDIGIKKGVPDPFLLSGSKLLSGVCKAVVTSVGESSIHGRTMLSLAIEPEQTPLQMRLDDLATGITKYGVLAALILFIVLFAKFLSLLGSDYSHLSPALKGSKFLKIFITAITIIVVAVPEGLPLAVTLALAFATTRMAKDSNLVRVLRSCEIMSSCTAICSDKTGTLTVNRMRVVNGLIAGEDCEFNEDQDQSDLSLDDAAKTKLLQNIALNSTAFENKEYQIASDNPFATSHKKKTKSDEISEAMKDVMNESYIGSKTETALLEFATKALGLAKTDPAQTNDHETLTLNRLRTNTQTIGVESVEEVIPFESSRKWSGCIVKLSGGKGYKLLVKGAAEIVIAHCCEMSSSSEPRAISSEMREQLESKITEYANLSLRTISLAHKTFPTMPYTDPTTKDLDLTQLLQDLTLDAVVGIKDPLRPGVKDSVLQCQRAGVTVRMVTGDNLMTAKAISFNCGILSPNDSVETACMEGPMFRKLSTRERFEIVPRLKVLARSSPEDKRLLVETLKSLNEVVAVTGDGTNDAPALKLADVGFSMGISGTEVAKEASDIILMSDDFKGIVKAIKWGRCVSTSIKKFIQFQITVNITAVLLTFISAVSSTEGESVLSAVQLLWVNLIMDTLAALALATDTPDDDILDKKPEGRKANLISVSMWKMILGQSTLQLVVTLVLHFGGKKIFHGDRPITDREKAQLHALTFNTFVWLQFFKLWVTRKLDECDGVESVRERICARNLNFFQHFFRNYYFLAIAAIIAGFQVLIMFVGGVSFSVVKQTGPMWAVALVCGMVSLPWGVVLRIIPDHWILAIFPTRLYNFIIDVLTLKFIYSRFSKGKKSQRRRTPRDEEEEGWNENDEKARLIYSKTPVFQRTKAEIDYILNDSQTETSSSYNPLSIYQNWKRKSVQSFTSSGSDVGSVHALGALTMVPTFVGGAVAGWSPIISNDATGASGASGADR
ncbi:hypothetical protein WICPIJ_009965 [Wickerhamomyces pijperi]|uniref:Calcium-transporting ATPase n=1 Tax=Wickerhamomyces pijperi TaxID=599730 RepID=A0A9P8PJ46_WICPI|nr:hypothetical protein WICPIJ_009965 [Wickerhamomyces pijperi]